MYETPDPETRFYRCTGPAAKWKDVLSGKGAYYSNGGRYNHCALHTVYASDHPLVAITEAAYYRARQWQMAIGQRISPSLKESEPPFVSEHLLWCFTVDSPPRMVDVSHPDALRDFGHRAISLWNPGRDYGSTQQLADKIREHPNPPGREARGLKAPSVRTPREGKTPPSQYVFFPGSHGMTGRCVGQWTLTVEFLDPDGQPIGPETRIVKWSRPQIRLDGPALPVLAHPARLKSRPLAPGSWHRIDILFC